MSRKLRIFISTLVLVLAFVFSVNTSAGTVSVSGSGFKSADTDTMVVARKKKKKKKKRRRKIKKDKKSSSKKKKRRRRRRRRRKKEREFETLSPEQMAAEDAKRKQQIKAFVDELRRKDDIKLRSEVGKKYDEAIQKLLKIISEYPSPMTLRRLAELYWKKGRRLAAEENERYQNAMDKWMAGDQKGPQPKFNERAGYKYYELAINVCFKIIEAYPDWEQLDEVYLFIGQNYNEMGEKDQGFGYFRKLVKEFPESQYAADAWFLIGEYYYDKGNAMEALNAYQNAIKDKERQLYGVAMRKIAWCYYNLSKFREAIDALKKVLKWSETKSGKMLSLRDDVLGDLVSFYAEAVADPKIGDEMEKEGRRFFQNPKYKKKYYRPYLIRLAQTFTNENRMEKAIAVYEEIIELNPLDKKNPTYQMHIVEAYGTLGDKEKTVKAIIKLVDYAKPPSESKWVKANIKKHHSAVVEAWHTAEAQLAQVVTDYHQEAMKTKLDETWDAAQEIYEIYLRYFEKDPDGEKNPNYYPAMYNYAQLLYDRAEQANKRWKKARKIARKQGRNPDKDPEVVELEKKVRLYFERAGDEFKKVADYDPKGKYFEDAAYSAIIAFERIVRTEIQKAFEETKRRVKKADKTQKLSSKTAEQDENLKAKFPRLEMPPIVKKFVDACESYIKSSKNTKYMVDVMYKAAVMYYVHNWFPEAAKRFRVIVDKYPRNKLAIYSANLILDSLNIEGDYAQLNEVARDYYNRPALIQRQGKLARQFKRDLQNLIEKSQFKICNIEGKKAKAIKDDPRAKEEQNALAAYCFVAFVREFNPYKGKDKAVFKMPKKYQHKYWSGSEWKKIRKTVTTKSQVADKALYNAIHYFVEAGYIRKAVALQHELLENKVYSKSKLLQETLFNLAQNYRAMAEYEKASKYFLKYYNKYPKSDKAKTALEIAMGFYINLGDLKTGLKLRDKYLKLKSVTDDEKDRLNFMLGYIYLDNDDPKNAEKAFKKYIASRKKDYKLPEYKKVRKGKGKKRVIEKVLDTKGSFCKGNADRLVMAWGELLDMYKKQHRGKERFELYDLLRRFKRIEKFEKPVSTRDARRVLAEAVFYGLEGKFNNFKKLNLKCKAWLPQKRFDKCIKEKLDKKMSTMTELEKEYKAIIAELKDPYWSVASLLRIGQMYENMSQAFFNSTVPNYLLDLDPMVYDVYIEKVQEKATQIEETAVAHFEEALKTARNYGVYNEFSRKAVELLQQYRPEEYPQSLEILEKKSYEANAYYLGGFALGELKLPEVKEEITPAPANTPVNAPNEKGGKKKGKGKSKTKQQATPTASAF